MSKFQNKVKQVLQIAKQQKKEQKRQARRQQRKAEQKQAEEQEMRYQFCDQIYDILIQTNDDEMTSRIVGIICESVSLEDLKSYIEYPKILNANVNIIKAHLAEFPNIQQIDIYEEEMRYYLCDEIYDILIQTNDEEMTSKIAGIINESVSIPFEDVKLFLKNPEKLNEVVNDIKAQLAKIPIVHQVTEETIDEEIVPRTTMIIHPIGFYKNPMDYYISLIQWCRQCAHYDNCPEALQEAIFELMGNEGKYKEMFSNPWKMLIFIKGITNRHHYFVMCEGGKERYENFMVNYIAENGRYLIMQKVTRILGHWGLSQEVKTNAYLDLKNHYKVTHDQIREMYLDPRKLAIWLKQFIPSSYTVKEVDAAMKRHKFYYY